MLLDEPLTIGSLTLPNRVMLAPMAGFSDVPTRQLAHRCGAGHTVGEMLTSKTELWHTAKSAQRLRATGCGIHAVQIAGSEPDVMAEAARHLVANGVELVDINFGCPAKKVCKKAAGSALLEQPDLVAAIVAAVVQAVPVPVTAKMRTGPSPECRNGVEVARRIAQAGAAALVVHGRTRACRFVGAVEFETARAIKAAVDIPVIVNGDIDGLASARHALEVSGADGVMLGRAAVGNPWLFGELLEKPQPSRAQKVALICQHVTALHRFYGETTGVRIARKHMGAYLEHLGVTNTSFNQLNTAAEQLAAIARLEEQQTKAA